MKFQQLSLLEIQALRAYPEISAEHFEESTTENLQNTISSCKSLISSLYKALDEAENNFWHDPNPQSEARYKDFAKAASKNIHLYAAMSFYAREVLSRRVKPDTK